MPVEITIGKIDFFFTDDEFSRILDIYEKFYHFSGQQCTSKCPMLLERYTDDEPISYIVEIVMSIFQINKEKAIELVYPNRYYECQFCDIFDELKGRKRRCCPCHEWGNSAFNRLKTALQRYGRLK